MANFCRKCGSVLGEEAKFCRSCGQQIISKNKKQPVCSGCGGVLSPNAKFCRKCGAKVTLDETRKEVPKVEEKAEPKAERKAESKAEKNIETIEKQYTAAAVKVRENKPLRTSAPARTELRNSMKVLERAVQASDLPGEISFEPIASAGSAVSDIREATGTLKILASGISGLFKGFQIIVRNPRKIIPALVLFLIWVLQDLLKQKGIRIPFSGALEWLTFTQNGTASRPLLAGSMLGKAVYAGCITSIVTAFMERRNPLANVTGGLKKCGSTLNWKDRSGAGIMLSAAGLAMIANNFLTAGNPIQNSILPVLASFSMLRMLGGRNGFIKRLISSIIGKRIHDSGKTEKAGGVNRVLAGMAAGFAISASISAIQISWAGYAAGAIFLGAGIGIVFTGNRKKEVTEA